MFETSLITGVAAGDTNLHASVATSESVHSAFTANALIVISFVSVIAAVYFVLAVVGAEPSVV